MFKAIRQFFKKDKPKFQQQVVKVTNEPQQKKIEVLPEYQKWRTMMF